MANNIIAFASSKGGTGKTTLAICLAAELVERGHHVTVIDSEKMGGTTIWKSQPGPVGNRIEIISCDTFGELEEAAKQGQKKGVVFIDAAGLANRELVYVLGLADVCLLPFQPSLLDALKSLETAKLVDEVSRSVKRPIQTLAVMNGKLRANLPETIKAELEQLGIKVAKTAIGERIAYPEASMLGSAPVWMGAKARKAAEEISALADELTKLKPRKR